MRLRVVGYVAALVCAVSLSASAQSVKLGQIAVFHANVGWIGAPAAATAADAVVAGVKSADIRKVTLAESAAWLNSNIGDGEADVFFTFGYLPETLYTPGNTQVDDSIIERFIDDGNVYLNTADYIFYVTLGGGANGENGLKTVTDSTFDMWTDGNAVVPTADGRRFTPSLANFTSNRSFKRAQVTADANWSYVTVFAEGAGGQDPAIIKDARTGGMVGIVMQVSNDALPRGAVITELMNNWLPATFSTTAVEAEGKATTAWGTLKARQ